MLGDAVHPAPKIISSPCPLLVSTPASTAATMDKKTGVLLSQLTEQIARVGTVWLLYQIHMREQTAVPLSVTMWGAVMGEWQARSSPSASQKLPEGTDTALP